MGAARDLDNIKAYCPHDVRLTYAVYCRLKRISSHALSSSTHLLARNCLQKLRSIRTAPLAKDGGASLDQQSDQTD
jgi:hypothetical protein